MIENAQRQACGNCGKGEFAVYITRSAIKAYTKYIVECLNCKSTTIIQPMPAKLEAVWGEGSEGILCTLSTIEK